MIVIGTPTRGEVLATFTYDLTRLLKYSPEAEWGFASGSYIPNNRLKLAHKAIEVAASHILFIDSDMRFPEDTLDRLLKADKDIVGANYKQRTQNEWTARKGGRFVDSATPRRTTGGGQDWPPDGLEEVDTLGTGVTLINVEVFKKLPEPWFAMPYDTSIGKLVGEDVYFCTIARENGYKIWVDHNLSREVKHTGSVEL